MSKDKALKLWLNAELPRYLSEDHVGPFRYIAAEAWHAAVIHTLSHMAIQLMDEPGDLTDRVMRMEP